MTTDGLCGCGKPTWNGLWNELCSRDCLGPRLIKANHAKCGCGKPTWNGLWNELCSIDCAGPRVHLAGSMPQERAENLASVKKELAQARARVAELEQDVTELNKNLQLARLQTSFHQSITNTYNGLYFEIVDFKVVAPAEAFQQELRRFHGLAHVRACAPQWRNRRHVFHSAPASAITGICRDGIRPSHCQICRGLAIGGACGDSGWFGDHTKGVYVSKHADYTTYYAHKREPKVGDEGTIVMFETILGPTRHMTSTANGAPPDPNFTCHESVNHLEFFMYDDQTQEEPPHACKRLMPVAVIKWKAVGSRGGIHHDGSP
eukprot:TRINITY_DN11695_c0_g1_i1.p1 TRINITY_DN11695_c0_g1~~TRINITY_DN11695_c0_g1_i1.p1  ORF type:complete len:319 (-),score=27.90 TRINITY_DN11695_c0_g1_i1:83-1039(-)